mmetsp:Transcript_33572/g.79682  ORF Transcript_33572/g.79682 Transcript_33572/m.79682 type:complete len:223 (-) Transcript_33572:575-1243(-)
MYLRSVFVPSAAAAIRPDSKANNFLGNETVSSSISSRQPQFLRSNQHSFQRELGIHSAGKQALPCKLKSLARRSHNRLTSAASSSLDVFVLDIDGVLIDSEPEISSSALKASADLWPGVFEELRFSERKPAVEEGLRKCRPRLIKGFEAMVMVGPPALLLASFARLRSPSTDVAASSAPPFWSPRGRRGCCLRMTPTPTRSLPTGNRSLPRPLKGGAATPRS